MTVEDAARAAAERLGARVRATVEPTTWLHELHAGVETEEVRTAPKRARVVAVVGVVLVAVVTAGLIVRGGSYTSVLSGGAGSPAFYVPTELPAGFRPLVNGRVPGVPDPPRGVLYGRSFGQVPQFGVRVFDASRPTNYPHASRVEVHGHDARLSWYRDEFDRQVVQLRWHEGGRVVVTYAIGMSTKKVVAISRKLQPIDASEFAQLEASVPAQPFMEYSGSPRDQPPTAVLASLPYLDGVQQLVFTDERHDDGTRWICVGALTMVGNGGGGSGQCADPLGGFAALREGGGERTRAAFYVVSLPRSTQSATIELADGRVVPMNAYDTGVGTRPLLFSAPVFPSVPNPGGAIVVKGLDGTVTRRIPIRAD